MSASSFAEQLLQAPAGVALLASLEVTQRDDNPRFGPKDCNLNAVRRAASSVWEMSYGELLEMTVSSAEFMAGPWSDQALLSLPYLYEHAVHRRPIAEAVSERFHTELLRDADFGAQQWWYEDPRDSTHLAPPLLRQLLVRIRQR